MNRSQVSNIYKIDPDHWIHEGIHIFNGEIKGDAIDLKDGWSPLFRSVEDKTNPNVTRIVMELFMWVGGNNPRNKPNIYGYLSSSGIVQNIQAAQDFRAEGEGSLPPLKTINGESIIGTGNIEVGGSGTGDKNYVHTQSTPSNQWIINHNLNKKVSVTVTDTSHNIIMGQVIINNGNTVIIEFNHPFSGEAIFN